MKIYRISGVIKKGKPLEPIRFRKEVRAVRGEHAIERIYSEMGSRHRAKRHMIKILKVEELEGVEPEAG